ncbi:MAG: hypothetical protein MUF57_01215, partial [Gammaproteobacteria bacterium]|nr:hypothetical protein [Gammaproteobacteria bacterium]
DYNHNDDDDRDYHRGNQGGSLNPSTWLQWIAVAAIAAAMGLGGAAVLPQLSPGAVRPDPFTGTDGRKLEAEMNHEIARLRADMERLDKEGSRVVQACQARVSALEARNVEMVQRLQRIEELLIELRVKIGKPLQTDSGRMQG